MKFDFGGYVTKNGLRCSDGRVIQHGAFKDCDGTTVPLVWQHDHGSPDNVLGHALLENRDDGVYGYCTFNDTKSGMNSKELVKHGDIVSLSIYANQLKQNGSDVVHGVIREVSLVLAGANPGAFIDNVCLAHGDMIETVEDEAVIYTGLSIEHADKDDSSEEKEEPKKEEKEEPKKEESDDRTVGEVLNTLTDEQKVAVGFLLSQQEQLDEAKHSEEDETMKHNVFDGTAGEDTEVLTHSEMTAILDDAKRMGSLKDAVLQHGITNIDVFFPDAKQVGDYPELITRPMEWVSGVLSDVHKTPFSKVRSVAANLTADEARARGYIKGEKKIEEQIAALKRETGPQTIYKLQALDRDDIVDITDFDVVAFLKREMRVMLDEEVARAILIGDGRGALDKSKIKETNVRPIWTDESTYTINTIVDKSLTGQERAEAFIDAAIRSRKNYMGSGSPKLYVGTDLLTDMRLIRDKMGHRLYKNDQELADELRVSGIVEIQLLDNKTRTVGGDTRELGGLIANLKDYNCGSTRGGEVNMFDDFDINYNRFEYLIETRMSGALYVPYSAIAIEFGTSPSGATGATGATGSTGTSGVPAQG